MSWAFPHFATGLLAAACLVAGIKDTFEVRNHDQQLALAPVRASRLTLGLNHGPKAVPLMTPPAVPYVRGDGDGDGVSDLLWRHATSGLVYVMPMKAGVPQPGGVIHIEPDATWTIAGIGDLDGDGRRDLVWWNQATGMVYGMLADGTRIKEQGVVYVEPDTRWRIAAVADFDGNGKADLLWRNSETGWVYLMPLVGLQPQVGAVIHVEPDVRWQILGAADFDGDNKADILWRNLETGMLYLMRMDGTRVIAGQVAYQEPNLAWVPLALLDADGDRNADLLWRNAESGEVYVQLFLAGAPKGGAVVHRETNLAWEVASVGDFDGDTKEDVVWRNSGTGEVYLMTLEGASIKAGRMIWSEPDPAWTLQGATTHPLQVTPLIGAFTATPSAIAGGENATLAFTFSGGQGVVTPGATVVASGGSLVVYPSQTTEYALTVTSPTGAVAHRKCTVQVATGSIASFVADAVRVPAGTGTTLRWSLTGTPDTLTLDGNSVLGQTFATVSPVRRQTYTLTATFGTVSLSRKVEVVAEGLSLIAGVVPEAPTLEDQAAGPVVLNPYSGGSEKVFLDSTGTPMFFTADRRLRKITPEGGVVTVAGRMGMEGMQDGPKGVGTLSRVTSGVFTMGDTFFFIDGDIAVRKMAPDGALSTLYGGRRELPEIPGQGFGSLSSIAVDEDGNVYISVSHQIRKITPGGLVTTLCGTLNPGYKDGVGADAQFKTPKGILLGADKALYVADTGNYVIRRVALDGSVSTFAGIPGLKLQRDGQRGFGSFYGFGDGFARDVEGNIFVNVEYSPVVRKVTVGGELLTLANVEKLRGFAVDSLGRFVAFDSWSPSDLHILKAVDLNGSKTTLAGSPLPAGNKEFFGPSAIAPDGSVIVSRYMSGQGIYALHRISENGAITEFTPSISENDFAGKIRGLVFLQDGRFFVFRENELHCYASNGSLLRTIDKVEYNSANINFQQYTYLPNRLAADQFGNVFMVIDKVIYRLGPDGIIRNLAGNHTPSIGIKDGTGLEAEFDYRAGGNVLGCDALGNVYVDDLEMGPAGNSIGRGPCLRKITPEGRVSTLSRAIGSHLGMEDVKALDLSTMSIPAGCVMPDGSILYFNRLQSGGMELRRMTPEGSTGTVMGHLLEPTTRLGAPSVARMYGSIRGLALTPRGDLICNSEGGIFHLVVGQTLDNRIPAFLTYPKLGNSRSITPGESLPLFCRAIGQPLPTITWQRSLDGTAWVDVQTGISDRFQYVAGPVDEGSLLRAVASNPWGSQATEPLRVRVSAPQAPQFMLQPVGGVASSQGQWEVGTVVSGVPYPTLVWQISEDEGLTWVDTLFNGYAYTWFSFNRLGNTLVRCVATNASGTTISEVACVKVVDDRINPSLTATPGTIQAGQASRLEVKLGGASSGTLWPMGTPVKDGDQVNVSPASTMTYTLSAQGPGGTLKAVTVTVTVN